MSNLTFSDNSSLSLDWDFLPLVEQVNISTNVSNSTSPVAHEKNYWALVLVVFPFLTLFGNVLVILSVFRERSLQTATNYFIVSLALADLLVAVVVMPFAVYVLSMLFRSFTLVFLSTMAQKRIERRTRGGSNCPRQKRDFKMILVNGDWGLPPFVCDFYIAMDVTCSTSSIFNLVAISIDRFIAVTQPIKYAKHKNNRRVWLTIVLVWVISAAIGSPIVLGLNNTPDRIPDLCIFYNSDFIIYSSLSSFYIPCIIMVYLYYSIFKALRNRAKKQKAARKPHLDMKPGIVIENVAQTRRLAETTLVASTALVPTTSIDDAPTNTGSGSQEEDEDGERSPGLEDCHVIPNDKSTEFILATVVEEADTTGVVAMPILLTEEKGNNDSGYAASQLEEAVPVGSQPNSPHHRPLPSVDENPPQKPSAMRRNGSTTMEAPHTQTAAPAKRALSASVRTNSEDEGSGSKKERKASSGTRFTIYKVNKASRKKREKSSAKKERKATKTLAIVLGVFLFCWVPFFTCNVMDAVCTKLGATCQPSLAAFIITTWLGYMNSFVNPVIYTIFNPEFRKAFKKLMALGT